jgi:hypothetical protein
MLSDAECGDAIAFRNVDNPNSRALAIFDAGFGDLMAFALSLSSLGNTFVRRNVDKPNPMAVACVSLACGNALESCKVEHPKARAFVCLSDETFTIVQI